MPPKSAKKAVGPRKVAAKAGKAVAKAQASGEVSEVKDESVVVSEVKDGLENIPEGKEEAKAVEQPVSAEAEEDENAAFEEDVEERLDLEDNEAEYDVEEEAAVDYDGKEIKHDDLEEVVEDEDERLDQEGDMVEDEDLNTGYDMEDGGEDADVEEYEENAEDEHDVDPEEEEQHHEVVKEHKKRKEFEVFVGGLDKDATEDDLRKVFSQVGEVTEIRLMMSSVTKKNKGFAFLRFATVEQAQRALTELKNPVIHGKQCGLAPCQDSDTLFVGNICKTWTKEHLKEKLKAHGIENIEDLTLVEDTKNEGMNRGFAFLEFCSRSDAMDAYRRLTKRDVLLGVDRTVKVAFADSFIEPDDEIMKQVTTVFIDGLPPSWDEDRVRGHLKKYGAIEKIELARNMPSARRKDFGFVTFDKHANAVACAEGINNADLGEGANKVKVRARLSRPHQKGRSKHGSRGHFSVSHGAFRGSIAPYGRPPPRRVSSHAPRPIGGRGLPAASRADRRPIVHRERHPVMTVAKRPRPLPLPDRSYERRPPIPSYPRSAAKRDYSRRDELPPPRSRVPVEYDSTVHAERRLSYKDDYPSRSSAYQTMAPRVASRPSDRHAYIDDGYERKLERPLPTYREGRDREYDIVPGSKRPYAEIDDARYHEVRMRQSRARLDYGVSSSSTHYGDVYDDRQGRPHAGYVSSRSSLPSQEGYYGGRQGMSYGGGSMSASDVREMYPSGYGSSYLPRGSDAGGNSYSSLHPGRNMSGSGNMGGGGSGSYY